MSRPEPRKSSLAGSNPISPPNSLETTVIPEPIQPPAPAIPIAEETPVSTAAPAANKPRKASTPQAESRTDEATTPATTTPAVPSAPRAHPHKVTFYQEADVTARVRGTLLHTQIAEGTRSLSQFINEAVMKRVEELEQQYNGGEPFPSIGSRQLPAGRPLGE